MDSRTLAQNLGLAVLDGKALYPVLIDLRDRGSYTDFLLICSGTSDRHVQSVAEAVQKKAKMLSASIVGTEGMREGQWALIDVGSVVVHVFHQFSRELYALETLWPDAPREVLDDVPASMNG